MANKWLYVIFAFVLSSGNFAISAPATPTDTAKSCETKLAGLEGHDLTVLEAHLFSQRLDFDKIKQIMSYFTGDAIMWAGLKLTERNSEGARELSRQMIIHFLKDLGYKPQVEAFEKGANIILEIPGTDLANEVVELGAHYDTEGQYTPGADDNGSGLSLVLHIAELLKKNPARRTVRLVFYDLEEEHAEGSTHRAQQIKKDPRQFIGALIVDMIGYFPKEGKNWMAVAEIATDNRESIIPALNKEMPKDLLEKNIRLGTELFYQLNRLPVKRLVQLSPELTNSAPDSGDHGSYWENDVPAILIAAPYGGKYKNPKNHKSGDKIASLNWPYYEAVASLYTEIVGYAIRLEPDVKEILENPILIGNENLAYAQTNLPKSIPREPELMVEVKEEEDHKPTVTSESSTVSYERFKTDQFLGVPYNQKALIVSENQITVIYKDGFPAFRISNSDELKNQIIRSFKENGGAYIVAKKLRSSTIAEHEIAFLTRKTYMASFPPEKGTSLTINDSEFIWYPDYKSSLTTSQDESQLQLPLQSWFVRWFVSEGAPAREATALPKSIPRVSQDQARLQLATLVPNVDFSGFMINQFIEFLETPPDQRILVFGRMSGIILSTDGIRRVHISSSSFLSALVREIIGSGGFIFEASSAHDLAPLNRLGSAEFKIITNLALTSKSPSKAQEAELNGVQLRWNKYPVKSEE